VRNDEEHFIMRQQPLLFALWKLRVED